MTSLDLAFKQALRTFGRFPFVILASLAGMAGALYANHFPRGHEAAVEMAGRLALSGWLGVPVLFSLALFAETRRLSRPFAYGLQGVGLLILAGYHYSQGFDPFPIRLSRFWVFLLAAHLLVTLAPALGRGTTVAVFWHYNQKMAARLALSLAHSLVLVIGVDLALLSIKNLFELPLPDGYFLDPGILALGAFNTWYFLAGAPRPDAEVGKDRPYPRGLRILAQFILLPLTLVYLIILYAYAARVLIKWEWPSGWISNLILGYSGAGLLSLLLVHPLQDKDSNRWIRLFSRHFYHMLFPLLLLLFIAIGKRIHDYGITEQRYFVLALAAWLMCTALYFTLDRDRGRDIRVLPASLCLMCLLVAFGPWGAFEASRQSQRHRLEVLLEKHGMLVGGKLAKAAGHVPRRDNEEISAIARYLEDRNRLSDLKPWIPAMDDPARGFGVPWDRALENKFAFVEALELPYLDASWRQPGQAETITFVCRACAAPVRKISGYDYLFVNYQAAPGAAPQDIAGADADGVTFSFDAEAGILRFVPRAAPELALDLGAHFRGLRERYPEAYDLNLPEEEMILAGEDKTLKVSVRMRRLSGEAGDAVRLREFAGDLLVRIKGRSRPRD